MYSSGSDEREPSPADSFDRLTRQLQFGRPLQRLESVRALAAFGAHAVAPLGQALTDRDLQVCSAAAEVLGSIGDARATAALGAALAFDRWAVIRRGAWCIALAALGAVAISGSQVDLGTAVSCMIVALVVLSVVCSVAEERATPFYLAIGEPLAAIAERGPAKEASEYLPTLRLRTMLGRDWAIAVDAIERIESASGLKNLPIAVECLGARAESLPQPAMAPPEGAAALPRVGSEEG